MPANTIGIHVNKGNENQSELAIKQLNSFNNKNIQYISNGGECKTAQYKVDNYDKNTKIIYEFYGCYQHGCPKCYNRDSINRHNYKSMEEIYTKTMERKNYFILQEYKLVTRWECEISNEVKNAKLVSILVSSLPTNLDLHDSFY